MTVITLFGRLSIMHRVHCDALYTHIVSADLVIGQTPDRQLPQILVLGAVLQDQRESSGFRSVESWTRTVAHETSAASSESSYSAAEANHMFPLSGLAIIGFRNDL